MFKPKLPQQQQGFTLVEVLVAILIASLFVTVAMEAMVLAAVFKARARQYTEATNWIQEDLENVKSQAALPSTILTSANGNALVVASTGRFEVGDQLKVGTDSTNYVIQSITPGTLTITLTPILVTTPLANASVKLIKSNRCNATTANTGFGDYLNNNLPALSSSGLKNILGKNYTLTRSSTVRNVAPYDVLQLTYSVAPQSAHTTLTNPVSATSNTLTVASASGFKVGDKLTVGTDSDNTISSISGNTITLTNPLGSAQSSGAVVDASIATVNTEVIPDAAFQCP